jgi:hypothetical protein
MSLMSQTRSVIAMNVRSIPQRLWMSLATAVSIALVVAVLLGFLSLLSLLLLLSFLHPLFPPNFQHLPSLPSPC